MKNETYRGEKHHSYGKARSEETKRKISETRKKNKIVYPKGEDHAFYGKHHSEDSKKKISETINNLGLKGENHPLYGTHPSDETKKKLSDSKLGKNNNFYGKKHSAEAKEKNRQYHTNKYPSLETRKKMSESHKGLFAGENNPMYGKPSAFGSGWGWSGWYKGWHFRSLGELSYVIDKLEANGLVWQSAEIGKYRIPYKTADGSNRTYCADFIVGATLIEVKCKRMQKNLIVMLKKEAAIKFCKNLGLVYEIVDSVPMPFIQLKSLVDSGKVTLVDRWNNRFNKLKKEKNK